MGNIQYTSEQRKRAFWAKVAFTANPDRCWEWQGYKTKFGYGRFRTNSPEKTIELAHRVAYRYEFGLFPNDLCVLHKCDNPSCVNPRHLFLGTYTDNSNDKIEKNRQSRLPGERNGRAKLTADDVRAIRKLYHNKIMNLRQLAIRYNMGQSSIWDIITRKNWSHIDDN